MKFELNDVQRQVHEAFEGLLSRESSIERVRAAETTGFDPELWRELSQIGAVSMGVPDDVGGAGAGLGDLAVVAGLVGRHLVSAPWAEAVVAARVLARNATASGELLADVLEGRVLCSLALRPAIEGVARLVPGGSVAQWLVVRDGDRLDAVALTPESVRFRTNLGSAALADCDVSAGDRITLATGETARMLFETATVEWKLLMAAVLAGLADEALRLGTEYAKVRKAFGVTIGWFQALSHGLASLATRVEGAKVLATNAAWATDAGLPTASILARMAFVRSSDVAEQATAGSLHVHGGYGYTMEQDIQLYYRRATAWALVAGDPRHEFQELASRLVTGDGTTITDLHFPDGHDEFRAEIRAFFKEHLSPELRARRLREGHVLDWNFHRQLASRGWLNPAWPREYGGEGRSELEMVAYYEEADWADAPVDQLRPTLYVAETLMRVGTEEQRQEYLAKIIKGDYLICLGYSEPDGGSDVASAKTRAVRDGDAWVINGQKIFTSWAGDATHVFLLCRTNTEVPRHQGLTLFLVPMDTPGIEITPVPTLGLGDHTTMTFYSDVRVSDQARVGDVDDGWNVLGVALAYERGMFRRNLLVNLYRRALRWALDARTEEGQRVFDDPLNRERFATLAIDVVVADLMSYRNVWIVDQGRVPGYEASFTKIAIGESYNRASLEMMHMAGASGLLPFDEDGSVAGGMIEYAFRDAPLHTIAGGSSEIQREIIVERYLGLPRARPPRE